MDLYDKILGGLLGVACGDSLGATTEFESQPRPRDRWVTDIVGGGSLGWPAGAPTDDTDLTLAVLRGHLAAGDAGGDGLLEAVRDGFVDWFRGDPRDIGGTTDAAFRRLSEGWHVSAAGIRQPEAQANGSLMRCLPTGLVRADRDVRRREAAAISALSHASPICMDACVAYLDVASALVDGADVEQALLAPVSRRDRTAEVDADLHDPRTARGAPVPFEPGGWVRTALRLAVWAIRQERPAEELLVEVVNQGGDADTNGAIVGGLLGCRDGAGAWPQRWVEVLQVRDELVGAAPRVVAVRLGSESG